MRKTNIVLVVALVLSVLAGLTLNQANAVSAQSDSPVGLVVAYTPGQSITIVDDKGFQSEYALDPFVKIQLSEKASPLGVGSFVTIKVPASISKEKQIVVGIVVHPAVPKGWKIPGWVATPLVKDAAVPTNTLAAETSKVNETPTPVGTITATMTPAGTLTVTPLVKDTAPTDAKESGPALKANTFIEWLRSFFQQVLSGR